MSTPFAFPRFVAADIPTELNRLLGFSTACACGRTHRSTLAYAIIRSGALDHLVDLVRDLGRTLTILVVADQVTREIAGDRVQKMLGSDGHTVGLLTVPNGPDGRPHADEANVALVASAMTGADLGIAVGSGTVNDLTKLASFRLGLPYVTIATAPSMNGYTSAIAAILVKGVKRTIDCHQPLGIVADLDILENSPMHLIAAGLGDLESKPTATADFRLGGILRNTYYCPAPERVVLRAEERAAEQAVGLRARDPDAIRALTEALVLSGISMALAGSSSPASGGEHLISHFLDMTATRNGRTEGWHGAQVGVATLITAALFEAVSERSPSTIDIEAILSKRETPDAPVPEIRRVHGPFADEVIAEYRAKRLADDALSQMVSTLVRDWQGVWANLGQVLRPAAKIRNILRAASAPTTATALGLSAAELKFAVKHARYIRGRFTVLDLADDLGAFDSLTDTALQSSGCLL